MIHLESSSSSDAPILTGPILQTLKFHEKRMAELKVIAGAFSDAATGTLEDGEKAYVSNLVLGSYSELRYLHNKSTNLITVRAVAVIKRRGMELEVFSTQKWTLSISDVLNLLSKNSTSHKDLPTHISCVFQEALDKKNQEAKQKQAELSAKKAMVKKSSKRG